MAFLTCLVVDVSLSGCLDLLMNSRAKVNRGKDAYAPVVAALREYHQATGTYPDALAALVPEYLAAVPDRVNRMPVLYGKEREPLFGDSTKTYQLVFSYVGPGMNQCHHSPETKWRCWGYYSG